MRAPILAVKLLAIVSLAGCNSGGAGSGGAGTSTSPGWIDTSTAGVEFQLPADWKVLNLATGTFEEAADKALGNDPKFAGIRMQAAAVAKQGVIKLMAFETSSVGKGVATNCNVIVQDMPSEATLELVADATMQQNAKMAADGTKPTVEYVDSDGGKLARIRTLISPPDPATPVIVTLVYIGVNGSKMATVTFTAPASDEKHLREVAEKAMSPFRWTN